ncbi:MAG: 8-amino-7-oxononanoate synthase [Thermodesulfobacteriota bacterium]
MSTSIMDDFSAWIRSELDRLEAAGLRRAIPEIDRGADRRLELGGRRLLNLASNNYLGLAGHPALAEAACRAAREYGAGSGASRLVTGNTALHDELDRRVAAFKGQEAALCFTSGFAANLALFSAFAGRDAVVFSDRLNHASIIDGILLSGAKHVRYRHNDPEHLARLLEQHRDHPRKLLATDTVFSMDGDAADLATLAELCGRHKVPLAVDEAHATGVLGRGRGLASELGLEREAALHMGTFSKALGSLGGYVAGSRDAIDLLLNKGRAFVFTTALPPAVAAANLAALDLAEADPSAGPRLLAMARDFRAELQAMGFATGDSATQIIPVLLGPAEAALRARDALLAHGVYVAAIRPPTVPPNTARLRISLRADLTPEDLDLARTAFRALAAELGR